MGTRTMSDWQPFAPRGATELRYGYTLDDLRRLAGAVVKRARRRSDHLDLDRLEVAWSAIAEALYAAPSEPSRLELFRAGRDGLCRHDAAERHHHGVPAVGWDERATFGGGPAFQRYWRTVARPSPSFEDRVVERVALAQILPRLSAGQRRALLALATFDDYQEAARALGIEYRTFTTVLHTARLRFLALWHEGETPSRVWARDRRVWRRGAAPPAGRPPITVRMRASAKRSPRPTGPAPIPHGIAGYKVHRCRCVVCTGAIREQQCRERQRRRERSAAATSGRRLEVGA